MSKDKSGLLLINFRRNVITFYDQLIYDLTEARFVPQYFKFYIYYIDKYPRSEANLRFIYLFILLLAKNKHCEHFKDMIDEAHRRISAANQMSGMPGNLE